jgi:hypothetical protein
MLNGFRGFGAHAKNNFIMTAFMNVEETLATPASFRLNAGSVVTLQELPGTGVWPADLSNDRLIQTNQGVNIGVQWSVVGPLVALLSGQLRWKIKLYFEEMGPGEFDINNAGVKFVNYVPISGHQYNSVINIPAGTVTEGLHDISVQLRLYDGNNRPLPVSAFSELGKFQFYNA